MTSESESVEHEATGTIVAPDDLQFLRVERKASDRRYGSCEVECDFVAFIPIRRRFLVSSKGECDRLSPGQRKASRVLVACRRVQHIFMETSWICKQEAI